MGLNDKYSGGDAFYFTDKNGQHFTTDLAGRDFVSKDMVEESPVKFTDPEGTEYRVPSWDVSEFMKNNVAEGRKVRAMEEWTNPGNSRGGADNQWVSAFDDVRKKELSDLGWKKADATDQSILDTVFSGKIFEDDNWRAPENRGPDGEGDVAKDIAYHAENVGRGVVGAAVTGATGVVKTIGDLATAGGAFAADALGLDGVASGLRETKRAIDEKAGKVLDWTMDNVLGDAFFNEGDGTREMAKAGLKASEEVGGLYGLGKVISGVPIEAKIGKIAISEKIPGAADLIQGAAGAMGKTVGSTAAATGAMAGLMGAQGYEDTISAKEATGKDVTWRDQVAAGINGGVAAAIAPLYGKVAGLLGKEEATRVIQKSYGEMLKRAAVDVAEGAVLGGVQAVGGEAATAVQTGEIQEGAAKRVLTAAAVGGALVGATKMPGALGGWVRENRVNYARAATMQGESALAATRAGMPLERSRFTTDDVRAVTQNNEVVFQDGTVYVPARVDGNGKTLSDPKIVINDGTILSPAGKVIGVRGTKLGYMNEIRGEAATPAEAVYRQTDPEAPFKFRIVDPTTGESIENGALAGLEAPEGVRAWFEAKRAGTELPELDADGHAYTALWLQAHSVNPEISRAAQLGLEQVAAGKMDYRSAAEVVDNAIEQTKGWQYSIYGQFKRSGAVKPEAAAGTEAERAAEPVRTDLPALGNAAEAPRSGGAIPKATTANAELMLGYVSNGTIAPTEVPAAKILPAGETPTVAGAANSGTIIVRQNADGSFTAITGSDKIEEEKQSGAKAIKTVVVKEEDGWTDQASQALALVDALKNGAATPAETVKAVAKLGLSEEDLRGITSAVPDAEWVVKTASNLAPAAMDRLDDANLTTIDAVGNTVNVKTVGMDWENVQTKLIETMPTDVDADTASVAGSIAINAQEMDGVRIWDLAQWASVNATMPEVNDALNNGPAGIKTLEDLMAKDSAGTVQVEMPNGELETVNQVEAKAPKVERGTEAAVQDAAPAVDKSLELVAVPAKDGVFHCAQFPTVELKFENGTQYVSGLTPQLMLDSRNREQMGKFLNEVAIKAEQGGYTVAFEDGALVEIANDLVQNYVEVGREKAMAARAKSVGKVLLNGGLANEIVTDSARFEQALSEYPDGIRLAKDGKTWGFYSPRDGKIYLNGSLQGTKLFLNTTIHEFAHPAVMATRDANPELYNRGMELIAETDYYRTVADHPDYSGMSERSKREEALVRLLSERLEDIKAKVPAKIYKEIEEFVTAFWKRFGEANGIADLTPAMVQTMTIEDIADAIGAEMQSGRKFGTKKLDVQAGILKTKLDRFNSSKLSSKEHKKTWYEIRKDWKSLTENQKAALETWARDDKPLADLFSQLRNYDEWRAKTAEAVKLRLKKNPTKSQTDVIRSSREWYLANGTTNGMTPWAWLVDGNSLSIPSRGEEGFDWFNNFFNRMSKNEKQAWKRLFGGDGVTADLAILNWKMWARGANQPDGFNLDDDTAITFEEFMDAIVSGEQEYQTWKENGKQSLDERQEEYQNEIGTPEKTISTNDDYETFGNSDPEYDADIPLYRAGEIKMFADAKAANAKTGLVPANVMQQAGQDRAEMVSALNEMDGLNLPEDIPGKTSFGNASYGKTMENTTVCTRSLGIRSLTSKVAEKLGRPLTVAEQLYIAQDAFNYTDNPQCLYCYVAMDRMAKNEYFASYVKQMQATMSKLAKGANPAKVYKEFLNGRKDTKVMRARFKMWKELVDKDGQTITMKDVASEDSRAKAAAADPVLELQLKDAEKYAQSASWAKKVAPYRAYNGEILKWSKDAIKKLNAHYGLRFHSFSEASPAFIHEKMQMITDAAVRGLKGLEYTKEPWEVEIFAPTGMNFNIGTFAMHDPDPKTGEYIADGMQGMDWEKAKALREKFPGVSVVFVAINDSQVEWAGNQNWIDVVIPYHIVRTGDSVAKMMGWKNYKDVQEDAKGEGWTKKDRKAIYPSQHGNDKETYLALLKKNHLKPRFEKWLDRPWYMKLVQETRRPASETPALQPIFNKDAAYDALEMMQNRGGYFEKIGVTDERENEIAGKMAKAIKNGAQPRPAGTLRLSRGGVYTGSAANYEKPSLFKVGTGEGNQVYGWGLYGSTQRGVAETYAKEISERTMEGGDGFNDGSIRILGGKDIAPKVEKLLTDRGVPKSVIGRVVRVVSGDGKIEDADNELGKWDSWDNEDLHNELADILDEAAALPTVYEQTFFTNREDGDESHLLSWYEPEPEKLDKDIPKIFEEYGYIVKRQKKDDGWQLFKPGEDTPYLGWKDKGKSRFGDVSVEAAYKLLISALTPEQASRGLARHGWDGIKYPVDSYGAKAIKDGNVSGWNYVSFRDDNIRVDHKWRDGEMMFNRGPNAARAVFVAGRARAAEPGDQGEQTPGTLAASRELANQAPTPFSMAGQIHRLALPISEMEWLRKKLTGNVTPAHVGRPAGGGIAAASKSGKVVIEADVFGTVDKTDMSKEKQLLVAHGFFRNEDPTWCAGQTTAAIAAERGRSEDQLATQLLNLAKRRNTGLEAGGQGAARGAFAAEVAKIVMDMPDVPSSTTIGRVKTIGQGVRDYITAQIQYGGGTAASAEASMRYEAGQFLDWCYGGPIVDPATGATVSRGDQMSLKDLTGEIFGKFLIMPEQLEQQAPDWSAAIENAIATNPKLTDAWQQLSIRGLTTQAHAHVAEQIAASQSKDHERALAQLDAERREPIKAGGFLTDMKEQVVVGMHDTMGPVYIRINEAKKRQIAAKKKLMRTLTPAQRAVVQADIDRFIGQIATDMNKFELARTAWERGAWNEGRRYTIKIMMALNNMTERDGNTIADLSEYDNMQRIIETQGRAGSYGINPRQAQLILGDMARRLGAEKWTKLETTDREIHAVMEQEVINDPRFTEMFGQGFADYCRSQTHYVTTKRVFSPEELDAIDQARAQIRRLGIAGGDDVISQMYAYGGRIGAAADVGEENWRAVLKGSMAASQEALSATFTKQMALMNAVRRNNFVIQMRQTLLDAGVTGVRDMKRVDGAGYPDNRRYGHVNYMEGGQKRVLIVPRQIADGMRMQPSTAGIITDVNSLCRLLYIDYNVAYWNQNINRNNGSIEKNMPGMSEPWIQTIARPVLPGVNKIAMLALEHTIRKLPENVSLPLRLMLGQHTSYYFIPQAKRYADILTDPSAWQKKLWAAEDAGDIATVTEMQDDFSGVMEMLRGNMFVPSHYAYTAGQTNGFLEDVFDRNGLKLVQTAREEDNARTKFGKVVKAVNVFKKNQAQQEWEDVFAKTKAYLHDRMNFCLQRTTAETGNVVKKNVSIAEGERAGSQKAWIQKFYAQFFNMCEKGNVRHFKAYAERPGETFAKTARTWIGRLIGGLLTSGVIAKIMLDDDEVKGNPKKAAEKYGAAWDYAKFMQRSAQNISKYTKTNAEYQPIWTSPDGYTSIVLAAPLNDEDKVITPTADATVQSIAYAMGIGPAPKWGDAIVNSTIKAVTPDLQAATPIWNLGKTVIASMTDWNPTDQFRQAPMFDKDLHANKFRSLEDAEEFGVAAGMRLWNDFGGRAVIHATVNGVDNGRGSAPESLEAVLTKIPVLSPAIGRFVKIQVGSPTKRGETVSEDRELNAGAVRLCAKRLLQMSEAGIHESDPKTYEAKIAEWTKTYGLNPFEVMNLRRQYLNGWIQRTNRGAYDQKAIQKLMIEARKQGMDQDDVWLMLGE